MEKRLSSDTIKIMAMVFMMIDHIGGGIIEKIYLSCTDYNEALRLHSIDLVLRSIGRIAFPLFAYMLVMGFFYTRNRAKYLRNLCVFAIIAEIPFDLFGEGKIVDFSGQSVMVTLTLGVLMMLVLEYIRKIYEQSYLRENKGFNYKRITEIILNVLVIFVFSFIAYLVHSDYIARGIITIAIIYYLRKDKTKLIQLGPLLFLMNIFLTTLIIEGNMHATIKYCEFEAYAILAFPIMYMDSGERVVKNPRMLKWFGYWFYPVHQLLIYLISLVVV